MYLCKYIYFIAETIFFSIFVIQVFMIYLLGGSTIFLIIFMIKNKKRPIPNHNEMAGRDNPSMLFEEQTSNVRFSMGSVDNIAEQMQTQARRKSRCASELYSRESSPTRKISTTESGLGLEHSSSAGSLSVISANPKLRHVAEESPRDQHNIPYSTYIPQNGGGVSNGSGGDSGLDSTASNVRSRRRTYSVSSILSDSEDSANSLNMPGSDMEVAHYIALKTQTASLSHEGTSFYLRFGCLSKLYSSPDNNKVLFETTS